jgi:hypothetical protein
MLVDKGDNPVCHGQQLVIAVHSIKLGANSANAFA